MLGENVSTDFDASSSCEKFGLSSILNQLELEEHLFVLAFCFFVGKDEHCAFGASGFWGKGEAWRVGSKESVYKFENFQSQRRKISISQSFSLYLFVL